MSHRPWAAFVGPLKHIEQGRERVKEIEIEREREREGERERERKKNEVLF